MNKETHFSDAGWLTLAT